jgi:hypothetical protein
MTGNENETEEHSPVESFKKNIDIAIELLKRIKKQDADALKAYEQLEDLNLPFAVAALDAITRERLCIDE